MGSIPTKFQAERCHSRIICLQAYPIEYTDVFCFVIGAHQCQVSLLARHSGRSHCRRAAWFHSFACAKYMHTYTDVLLSDECQMWQSYEDSFVSY